MNVDRQPGLNVYRIAVDAAGVFGILAIFALAIGIGYLPMHRQRDSIEESILTDMDFLAAESEIETRHARLKECLTESENLLADLQARVPDEPNESEFLGQLAKLAEESGVELGEYQPGATHEEGKFGKLEIHFMATGTYDQICRFVHGLDDMPRFFRVSSLEVALEDPQSEVYPLDVELLVYFSGNGESKS
ncbi:MAG: type 4a pilus biogenesis protein PilO [Planctomycetes bacterium]|nr:type 4a pilus biogenesis protein PilO [Planctomycetota bacterium]MBL7043065.1 type 4a pilus biogenesis protein PilO [Pirellulaceae bacterium]